MRRYNGTVHRGDNMTLKRIGILAHPLRPQTAPIAEAIAEFLHKRGFEAWLRTQWEDDEVAGLVRGSDMVVAIGGDGSMLRAARVSAPLGVPVLGVNQGHLGFLTEITGEWKQPLETVLDGDYWIEERMMVQTVLLRGERIITEGQALNELVVGRGVASKTIQLEMYIDGDWVTTYNADALIISTATGSTAYALACGGPILPPELHNILIVPVAPHLSMDRPLVLSEGVTVEVIPARANTNDVMLTLDGVLMGKVEPGDRVRVHASEYVSRFVRLRGRNYFYRSLLGRLEPRVPARDKLQD
jgi:NAD+ kinase